jgi:alpha-1,3-glucan synthase
MWGEEQEFHVFDSTASNYLFGRQAMSSSQAWQDHGCYKLNSTQYYNFGEILDRGAHGCEIDSNSLDHRDPSSEVRRYLQNMYFMRENYPSLNDGFLLQKLSNATIDVYLPGSNGTPTEIGMWSVVRSPLSVAQDFTGITPAGNTSVWLIYTNMNHSVEYTFDCSDSENSLLAPFYGSQTVKNLFWPYEEYTLNTSATEFYNNGSGPYFGCLDSMTLEAFAFKAIVPQDQWIEMYPVITGFSPGHDTRILLENASVVAANGSIEVPIAFTFSQNMSCESVTVNLNFTSTTEVGILPNIKLGSVSCAAISPVESPTYIGALGSAWTWQGIVENVYDGVHQLSLINISNAAGTDTTRVCF